MAEDKSQKTEKPTPQRRKQAVKDGQVPRSADVTAWLTVLSFSFLAPMTVDRLRGTFETLMTRVPEVIARPEAGSAVEVLGLAAGGAAGAAAPMLLAAAGVALAGGAAQGGLKISPKRFKPKFEHLNVGKGIKRMVSGHAAWGLAKTLLKFAVLGVVAWMVLRRRGGADHGRRLLVAVRGGRRRRPGRGHARARGRPRGARRRAAWTTSMERRRVEKELRMSRDEIKRSTGSPRATRTRRVRSAGGSWRDQPQPDDGRRRHRRRGAGQPHARRRRAEVRAGRGRAAGGGQGRRRRRRPDP